MQIIDHTETDEPAYQAGAAPGDAGLQLSAEEMRSLGHRVIDQIVDHFQHMGDLPAVRLGDPTDLQRRLVEPLPEHGIDAGKVLDQVERDVLSTMSHHDHQRFFAFVPSPSNFIGVLADIVATGNNVFTGTWLAGSAATTIELTTIDWLCQLCGLPAEAGGTFVPSGSLANLTALAVARHEILDDQIPGAVIYCSDQTHASNIRALRLLGFHQNQVRQIPTGNDFRLPLDALSIQIASDRTAGLHPFCVIANAGSTNTAAVDPLLGLAALCRREGLWLHADGAYGAAGVLAEKGRTALAGIDQVDSLSLDPHKWLFQPYEAGCVLVRDRRHLPETFAMHQDYLQDAEDGSINLCDYGVQLTRSFRALKLWMSLKVFGVQAFRQAVTRGIELAEDAEQILRSREGWEIMSPAQLAVVSFRYAPNGVSPQEADAINRNLVCAIRENGYAFVSSTVLHGRVALRMCTINPRTTHEELEETIQRLEQLAELERHAR